MPQVSFTTDDDLKTQALKKAKEDGINLKTVLTYAMKAYVDGNMSLRFIAENDSNDVEELYFDDEELSKKAERLVKYL